MEYCKGESVLYDDLLCGEKSLPIFALFFSVGVNEFQEVLELCSAYNSPLNGENCPKLFSIPRHRVSYLNRFLSIQLMFLGEFAH